ncbi:TolB family protein [Lysobacter enzymogenes]|uniref:TolB family protein n=1 Tax=Lysobacter enzymogenes TaxID=69 RepID=UPI001A96C777|nr:PD40 domain-containing protein [Lysobacter enzymogenes]QQP96297.1 PD40 domain-containing protein [Lysobacter enzymogenes]
MPRFLPCVLSCALLATLAGAAPAAPAPAIPTLRLISQSYGQPSESRNAERPALSANGRYVAFVSGASDLTSRADDNGYKDVFVYDTVCREAERVSLSQYGLDRGVSDFAPSISANGRYVSFTSASPMLPGDPSPGRSDVFLYDRGTNELKRLGPPALLPDADIEYNTLNGYSLSSSVSADGRYVAFSSNYRGLVSGPGSTSQQIYLYDIAAGTYVRASNTPSGGLPSMSSMNPRLSADGNRVLFFSSSMDLLPNPVNSSPHAYVYDRRTGAIDLVDRPPGALPSPPTVVGSNGRPQTESEPLMSISGDGRYVAFASNATDLLAGVNSDSGRSVVYVRDTVAQTLTAITFADPNHRDRMPALDYDGGLVAYNSWNIDYQPGEKMSGIYLREVAGGVPVLLTRGNPGGRVVPENGVSQRATISSDGLRVAFESSSSNLMPGITSGAVYLADFAAPAGLDATPPACAR